MKYLLSWTTIINLLWCTQMVDYLFIAIAAVVLLIAIMWNNDNNMKI